MIYLRHHLERAGIAPGGRVGVSPLVNGWLRQELWAELRSVLPEARIELLDAGGHGEPYDLVVLPFTCGAHRDFLGEKTRPLLDALRRGARAVLLYDVVHRRADLVPRRALPGWYARRLGEYLVVRLGRTLGWRRS
jgi:hypothetical protein